MKKGALIIALVLAGAVASGFVMNHATTPIQYRYDYTVKSGDTLWNIASEACPEGMDVREYIHEISKMNGIDDGRIRPGQTIELYHY